MLNQRRGHKGWRTPSELLKASQSTEDRRAEHLLALDDVLECCRFVCPKQLLGGRRDADLVTGHRWTLARSSKYRP